MTGYVGFPNAVGKYVFIPGSIERAALIAGHLENASHLMTYREFSIYQGRLAGVPVLVVSTGIGECSVALVMEELIKNGANTFLRIGSCASASPHCSIGDVVVATGAVRMEHASYDYLPKGCPCVPDFHFTELLCKTVRKMGYPCSTGVSITKDSFFTEVDPQEKPVGCELVEKWESFEKAGAESTSMEEALIFAMGKRFSVRVASIAICATNFEKASNEYPSGWENRAIIAGVTGMESLIKEDLHAK